MKELKESAKLKGTINHVIRFLNKESKMLSQISSGNKGRKMVTCIIDFTWQNFTAVPVPRLFFLLKHVGRTLNLHEHASGAKNCGHSCANPRWHYVTLCCNAKETETS